VTNLSAAAFTSTVNPPMIKRATRDVSDDRRRIVR
jgi:hypothetical protein